MRRTTFALTLSCLALGLLLGGCDLVAGRDDPARREAAIHRLLVRKLGDDARTARVTVVGGKVTLTGQVGERSTAELAEEVALTGEGVTEVSNQLEAANGLKLGLRKLGAEAADAALEAAVKGALGSEIGAHARRVEVEACDGTVSLRGSVPDRQRLELARRTAAAVDGVTRVVDLLAVEPAGS